MKDFNTRTLRIASGPAPQLPLGFLDALVSRLTEELRSELAAIEAPAHIDELVCQLAYFAFYTNQARAGQLQDPVQADFLPQLKEALALIGGEVHV